MDQENDNPVTTNKYRNPNFDDNGSHAQVGSSGNSGTIPHPNFSPEGAAATVVRNAPKGYNNRNLVRNRNF